MDNNERKNERFERDDEPRPVSCQMTESGTRDVQSTARSGEEATAEEPLTSDDVRPGSQKMVESEARAVQSTSRPQEEDTQREPFRREARRSQKKVMFKTTAREEREPPLPVEQPGPSRSDLDSRTRSRSIHEIEASASILKTSSFERQKRSLSSHDIKASAREWIHRTSSLGGGEDWGGPDESSKIKGILKKVGSKTGMDSHSMTKPGPSRSQGISKSVPTDEEGEFGQIELSIGPIEIEEVIPIERDREPYERYEFRNIRPRGIAAGDGVAGREAYYALNLPGINRRTGAMAPEREYRPDDSGPSTIQNAQINRNERPNDADIDEAMDIASQCLENYRRDAFDKLEILRRRMQEFRAEVQQILNMYRRDNKNMKREFAETCYLSFVCTLGLTCFSAWILCNPKVIFLLHVWVKYIRDGSPTAETE